MSFRSRLKKIGMVFGSIGIVLVGSTAVYWSLLVSDYEANIALFDQSFTRVAVIADSGLKSPGRALVEKDLRERCPQFLLAGGDNCYDQGCIGEAEYQRDIKVPFGDLCPGLVASFWAQGNHDSASLRKEERDFMARKLFSSPVKDPTGKVIVGWKKNHDGKIYMPNYFYGVVFKDYCLGVADNTMYMARLGDPPAQKLQEKFLKRFYKDSRCEGKRKGILWHIPILSAGHHGDSRFEDHVEFYEDVLEGEVDDIFSGHDHNLSFDGCRKKTCHFVSGAVSKLRPIEGKVRVWAKSVFGYLWVNTLPSSIAYEFIEVSPQGSSIPYRIEVAQ